MIDWIDETEETPGTEFDRSNMMAMQGYQTESVVFNADGYVKTNKDGQTETVTFADGKIVKNFVGKKAITQTIIFNNNGYTKELS